MNERRMDGWNRYKNTCGNNIMTFEIENEWINPKIQVLKQKSIAWFPHVVQSFSFFVHSTCIYITSSWHIWHFLVAFATLNTAPSLLDRREMNAKATAKSLSRKSTVCKSRVKRRASNCTSEQIMVCWHCGASGHEKKICLTYHLDRAMVQLLPNATNPHIRELVKESARNTLETALLNGKQGAQLSFGGSPWQLNMEWPMRSPPPPFPTPGVWYLGVYYGDD